MILECSIRNFRSIFEKQTFSMLASSSRSKIENTMEISLANGELVKLIKTAAIYGANSSGKSNFIRALFEIRRFIVKSNEITVDKPIQAIDQFVFNSESKSQPTEFEIVFIIKTKTKFQYRIAFNENEIIEESLFHFPNKKPQNIFKRGEEKKETDENIHIAKLGKNFGSKQYEVYKKLPFLAIFGKADHYHTTISPIFTYFNELEIWNVTDNSWIKILSGYIKQEIQKGENNKLVKRLERLLYFADTQIHSLVIDKENKIEHEILETTENISIFKVRQNEVVFSNHKFFDNKTEKGIYNLPFFQESFGTNKLFALGGLILMIIEKGGVIIFDELDSSMHSILSKLLIQLFHSNQSANAQLIFTTHEINLLSKELRSDQIWFAEKNVFGETEIFSAQDFDGVREDIPFDKWYLGGKFGAIPHISEIQSILDDGETEI